MAKLTPEQLKHRLKFDYEIVMKMKSEIMNVTAYRDAADLENRRRPIVNADDGQFATHYLVDYRIPTLVARDVYSECTTVKFDLLANGNYPYTRPGCFVVSSMIPWTPHFKSKLPICIDPDMWEDATGNMLLGHLLEHVAKLLNFDEIPRSPEYGGYNPEAADYWRTVLNSRPLNPKLIYPCLPKEISLMPASVFTPMIRLASEEALFKPISPISSGDSVFVPVTKVVQDTPSDFDVFRPMSHDTQ